MNVKLKRPHFSQPVQATKAAMLTRIQELEQQLASERQAHNIMDAAYWAVQKRAGDAEAKLAVATGLLRVFAECKCCPASFESNAFLADPSQAAAQYREALAAVQERVKAHLVIEEEILAQMNPPSVLLQAEFMVRYLKTLLGDAAQEEKP